MKRCEQNPIITPEGIIPSAEGYRVRGVFNPAAVRYRDEIILLVRVAEDCPAAETEVAVPKVDIIDGKGHPGVIRVRRDDPDVQLRDTRGIVYRGVDYLSTMSHLRIARSRDGIHFTVDPSPFLFPSSEEDIYGIEDARITEIEDTYHINYTCVCRNSWATALAETRDFTSVERKGIIFCPENKDVSIFPEQINGRYCALHRPNNSGFGTPGIWYAESPDLIHWGRHRSVLDARQTRWESMKIGSGGPSIKTSEGWLQIYHGKGDAQVYSLFAVLFDLREPWRVLKRGSVPILTPEANYETSGFFPNVIFTNGQVVGKNGHILLYYGASDETVCLAETSIEEVLSTLR